MRPDLRRKRIAQRKRAELAELNSALARLRKHRGRIIKHPSHPQSGEILMVEKTIQELRLVIVPLRHEINQILCRPPCPKPLEAWGFSYFIWVLGHSGRGLALFDRLMV